MPQQKGKKASAIIPTEKRARIARRTSPGDGRQAPGCCPVTGRGKTGCSGLSAKDRPASVLARDPKGLLLLRIETVGCSIRASSGCCSLPEKARVYTAMANGWVHSFAGRAARIFAKGQPSTVALGLFSRRELKLFAGVFPLSIAQSLTPGTRRTGAALAGNPVAEAWCSCRWMAGGQIRSKQCGRNLGKGRGLWTPLHESCDRFFGGERVARMKKMGLKLVAYY
ncbi:Seryl-tRNA synthetase [Striga asiatica]|uniref:Seryl-tRNA synthetase n=1 Tax=Striga asiatica TaxID=4170 RepID=A0A5A7PEA2_STRAF|nr:Seryl-tRNA synthetase [Striga asiatica]